MLQKMRNKLLVCITIIVLLLRFETHAAPRHNDITDNSFEALEIDNKVNYNAIVSHFKDFMLYLPVMMTTLKETMQGFPKFAEGLRILTSKTGRLEDECNCHNGSNEI